MVKAFVRRTLQRAGWDIHRSLPPAPSRLDRILAYKQNGCVPWSPGYQDTRDLFVEEALDNTALLDVFRRGAVLPPEYGIGLDERVVEYPWTFSRLPLGEARILDAGSVLNNGFLVAHPLIRTKTLHIITLVPEGRCHCAAAVSHLYEDLRAIPISNGYYDIVVCISTLEHVGMDNTLFRGPAEDAPDDYLVAVREMRRVLKPGGVFLLTVPFGPYMHFGTFQLFDRRRIEKVVAAFAPSHIEETYFRYTAHGWTAADASTCADAEYVPWIAQSPQERPPQCPVQPDNAAAARAVACLRMSR